MAQPAFATPLTRGHLRRGLVYAVLFNGANTFMDSARVAGDGSYVSGLVSFAYGVNRFGAYTELTAAGLNERISWGNPSWIPASNLTISLCYEKTDATNRNSIACSIGYGIDGLADAINVHLPYSDGVVYFDFGGNDSSHRVSVGGLTFGADHWVFSTGPRGQEIWQNGIKRASNANNPTRTPNLAHNWNLGGSEAGFTASDLCRFNMICMWDRQLLTEEIGMISADPYAPWEPVSAVGRAMVASAVGFGIGAGAGGAGPLVGEHRLAHAGGTTLGGRQLASAGA